MPRRDDDYDDDDQPRPRRRDDDDYDDDDRPRQRRRRRHDDDEYDDRPRRKRQLTGLDGMFANTSMVALILFGLCCGEVSLILGIVGLAACEDETARRNAIIVTIVSAVRFVIVAAIVAIRIAQVLPIFGR